MLLGETVCDDIFDALSDRRRRRLLLALRNESDSDDPKMDIDRLAEAVATSGGADRVGYGWCTSISRSSQTAGTSGGTATPGR